MHICVTRPQRVKKKHRRLTHSPGIVINTNITVTTHEHHIALNHQAPNCFFNSFISIYIYRKYQSPRPWLFLMETTSDRWIPLTKVQWNRKRFNWWCHNGNAWCMAKVDDLAHCIFKTINLCRGLMVAHRTKTYHWRRQSRCKCGKVAIHRNLVQNQTLR